MSETNTFPSSREAYEYVVAKGFVSKRVAEVLHAMLAVLAGSAGGLLLLGWNRRGLRAGGMGKWSTSGS
jgi:hypothetical protein